MTDSTRQILANQHTPGPWRAYGYEVVGEDNERIALTNTPTRPHPEEHANATLIATAPELLTVLRGVLLNAASHIDTEWLERAADAIAKAEGRAVATLAQVVEDQQA